MASTTPPPEPSPEEVRKADQALDKLFPGLDDEKRAKIAYKLSIELARRGQKMR